MYEEIIDEVLEKFLDDVEKLAYFMNYIEASKNGKDFKPSVPTS